MRITLKNDFHNREVQVNAHASCGQDGDFTVILTKRQAQRTKKLLCGIPTCACSDEAGTRGLQHSPPGKKIALILVQKF